MNQKVYCLMTRRSDIAEFVINNSTHLIGVYNNLDAAIAKATEVIQSIVNLDEITPLGESQFNLSPVLEIVQTSIQSTANSAASKMHEWEIKIQSQNVVAVKAEN